MKPGGVGDTRTSYIVIEFMVVINLQNSPGQKFARFAFL